MGNPSMVHMKKKIIHNTQYTIQTSAQWFVAVFLPLMVCVGNTRTAAAKGGNVSAQIRHSGGPQISVGGTPAFHVCKTKSGRKKNTLSAVHECSPARPRMNQTSAKHPPAKRGEKLVPDENQITKICVPCLGLFMSCCERGGDINKGVFGNFESVRNQVDCKKKH